MNKEAAYLKMKTPADMLAVNYFSSTGQLKGRFIQEIDPPWTIWWQPLAEQTLIGRIGNMIKGELPPPETVWEPGQPNGECREISWLDLFRKAVIKPLESRQVANEVVLITSEKEVFFDAVKQHFMLQQGQLEFAVFDSGREYYVLRIISPSLWVFNTLKGSDWVWYNLVPGQSGIYVEAGFFIHDISGDSCFNQFQITENGILLVQKDGRLLTLKPKWRKGDSLIKVQFEGPSIQQKEEQEILSVKPVLRSSDHQILPTLWKIEDQQRFKAILVNESLGRFRNYQALICKNGHVWVFARGKQADRGLASILTDAFMSFSEICQRVFVPGGKMLAPKLSSERLHEIIGAGKTDFVILEYDQNNAIVPGLIFEQDWASIEEFITLQAEQAATRAEAIQTTWKFEFKDLKKKKQVVEVEIKTAAFEKLEAVKEGGEVGAAAGSARQRRQKTKINLADVPEPGASEISGLRIELDQIDIQLLQNVADARLWQQRAEICRRMRMRVAAVASLMNASLLNKDNQALAECVFEFAALRPEFKALTHDEISELDKGRLLADIRKESVNAEFHYVLMLVYAAKFGDYDIFEQAITGMKTSFPGENRSFYGFNEIRSASGGGMNVENRVELLTENNFSQIALNAKKFVQQVNCCPSMSCLGLVKFQLHKILSFHLSQKSADNLVPLKDLNCSPGAYRGEAVPRQEGFMEFFYRRIDNWPESLEYANSSAAVSRWLKLLVMDKIGETPLRDFFTGDLYKPPYYFYRREEESRLLKVAWIRELPEDQFPETSDGRPIARAIYYRFADNNPDWEDYFKQAFKSGSVDEISKSQRLLLLMVSEFGPHPAFRRHIMPMVIGRDSGEKWDIYNLTMYCDMFRLCLAYKIPVDEQRLFNMLIQRTPRAPHGWDDFRNSAEWIILCLLLTNSPKRRFLLDDLISRVMHWLRDALNNSDRDRFAEALTIYSFLCIGILADLVPEKLELHQLVEKRKVIWMEHSFAASARGRAAFAEWQQACGY